MTVIVALRLALSPALRPAFQVKQVAIRAAPRIRLCSDLLVRQAKSDVLMIVKHNIVDT